MFRVVIRHTLYSFETEELMCFGVGLDVFLDDFHAGRKKCEISRGAAIHLMSPERLNAEEAQPVCVGAVWRALIDAVADDSDDPLRKFRVEALENMLLQLDDIERFLAVANGAEILYLKRELGLAM